MLTVEYWCQQYVRNRSITKGAAYQLRRSCRLFAEHAGSVSAQTITTDLLSDWLAALEQAYSPRSVRNHRANILSILRFAADRSGCPEIKSRHVRLIKLPAPAPWAWSQHEIQRLVQAARELRGQLKNRPRIARAHYALALIGAAYDTGLRRGDLFALEKCDIAADGIIRLRINKTSQPHVCRLSASVAHLVLAIPYERPLRWAGPRGGYCRLWRELTTTAGIRHGSTQQVRRTAATTVWEESPALVQQFLGHRTADMWRYYVDCHRSARPVAPRPLY